MKKRILRRLRRALVVSILGGLVVSVTSTAAPAPQAWVMWDAQAAHNAAVIDHTIWQRFLDKYLVAHADAVNRVAYQRVTSADREQLQGYLDSLSRIDPRDYPKPEQLAYWINLYNAITVDVVLSYPSKGSILRMGLGLLSRGPWDDELISIVGQEITLNDIEHRILRPIWHDHRIHYAVNCASMSCPNIAAWAYTSENTEQLLAAGEIDYINHARGVRFDSRGRLILSQIYQWYAQDFAADASGLLVYLSRHHKSAAQALATYSGRIDYAYDWSLNKPPD